MDKKGFIKIYRQARAASKKLHFQGVNETEAAFLLTLSGGKMSSNKDIITHLFDDHPDGPTLVSLAVKKFLDCGVITQTQDDKDRRVKHSHLTVDGKLVVKDIEEALAEI